MSDKIWAFEESTLYQDILQEAMARGMAKGEEAKIFIEGFAEGFAKGFFREARQSLLRLGRKRFGRPRRQVEARIESITDLITLHALQDRILDVSSWGELFETPRRPPSRSAPKGPEHTSPGQRPGYRSARTEKP